MGARPGHSRPCPPLYKRLSVSYGPDTLHHMITELVVLLAALALQHKIHAALAVGAVCCISTLAVGHRAGVRTPFMQSAQTMLMSSFAVLRSVLVASTLVVAAACGFVSGQWGAWVVTVVTVLSAYAVWRTLVAARQRAAEALVEVNPSAGRSERLG